MYHFISVYLCLQRWAQKAIGNWNFPSTKNSLHVFGALRIFLAGWLWCSCCCAEQERCHATTKGATGPSQFFWRTSFPLLWDRFCDFHCNKLSCAEGLPGHGHCWQTIVYILMLQKLHETVSIHLRKGWMTMHYRVKTLQNGFGKKAVDAEFLTRLLLYKLALFFLNTFYKTMNALVWFHKIVIMAVDQNHPVQLTGNTIS